MSIVTIWSADRRITSIPLSSEAYCDNPCEKPLAVTSLLVSINIVNNQKCRENNVNDNTYIKCPLVNVILTLSAYCISC